MLNALHPLILSPLSPIVAHHVYLLGFIFCGHYNERHICGQMAGKLDWELEGYERMEIKNVRQTPGSNL